jgi:hypothetical protein
MAPLQFDAAAADQLAALVQAWRGHLNLDDADIEWGLRVCRAYADLPPITTGKQCRAYRRRVADGLAAAFGRNRSGYTPDAFKVLLRTADGVLLLATMTRIDEWDKQRGAGVAGKIRRLLNGSN